MKKTLYAILCLLFVNNSCLDRALDRRCIKVINNSNGAIYCLMSQSESFKDPYYDYTVDVMEKYYRINKDTSVFLKDKPRTWEGYISNSKNGKMRIFIVSKDSVNKYGWEILLTKNIYTKVFKMDMKDLEKDKWQIIYTGK